MTRAKNGYVLVYTLWMLSLLSTVLFSVSTSLSTLYRRDKIERDRVAFVYEAHAVAKLSLWRLLNSYPPAYPGLLSLPYETKVKIQKREYLVRIDAEDGNLPASKLSKDEWERFLISFVGDRRVAEKIAIDIHNYGRIRSINELYWIVGEDKFPRMREYLSNHAPRLNVNYASDLALYAIGLSRSDIELIKLERSNGPVDIRRISNPANESIILRYIVSTPRPTYYRVKVQMMEPVRMDLTLILSPDMQILDRL
ncbi:MAG: hypothetical protein NZ526_02560 [Aquificaceae bacterium]|nr:hypothetical protein [Aquificaceae bacterium]